ncbi:unnamed protein product [Rotaria sordida]|uniref:Cryptochrome/DNA photolyase FAD-binding domain-containing protein n=1 Tax=Rotaria sordida TaxID=392033 RepID=A0A819ZE20_9BILA|nr:unnamed protein product [Rotaria sordida]CAF1358102.1 unnamed protein product [Rotaria sordida]CAF1386865.1 unnamed protein product [Rotaria sordida]CAF1422741.1 unnamed protein product [Rotaria sordida]CAF1605250.1 unnamed protein product [Rotaria sordida]
MLVWISHMNNDYVIHMYCCDPRQITDKTCKCDFVKSFPDIYTHLRVALEKQGIQLRRLINIPNTFKALPDLSVSRFIPTDVGTDPRENRYFNMVKQTFDYDPNGIFVRTWCHELARLSNEYI